MHVAPVRGESGFLGVAGEQGLDPALAEPSLTTDEEDRVIVCATAEVSP